MITQFVYKGSRGLIGLYYSGPSWIVLLVPFLALVLIGFIIVTRPADILSILSIIRGK